MSTIVLRSVKGSGLTNNEIDANFTNLNTDKLEATQTVTLTNKTLALGSNTVSGTTAQFNTALSDGDFATLAGTETLTNKTLTAPVLANPSYSGATANGGTVTTIDINGGTIDGTVIGGAVPAAGSFTTVSASGLSAGTNTAYNGYNPYDKALIYAADAPFLRIREGSVADLTLGVENTDMARLRTSMGSFGIGVGAVLGSDGFSGAGNVATFTSTGLNNTVIGATTPAAVSATTLSASGFTSFNESALFNNGKRSYWYEPGTTTWLSMYSPSLNNLDVASSGGTVARFTAGVGLAVTGALSATGTLTSGQLNFNGAGTYEIVNRNGTGIDFYVNAASLKAMELTASGNLGLGVTPSAWSQGKAIEIGTAAGNAIWGQGADDIRLMSNAYYNAGYKYANTNQSCMFSMSDSSFTWFTAPSGTAGNTITFTQAMTLDASGNLGLGVTPSAWGGYLRTLDIGPGSSLTNANSFTQTWLASNAYYDTAWKYKNTAEASYYEQAAGTHKWYTAPSGTAGNAITFTQAMTLDASGNLLVGVTADTNVPTTGVTLRNSSGTTGNIGIGHASGVADGNPYINFAYNAGGIGSITQSGTTAVLYNTTSDARLKENITDASDAASLIDALQVRQFDWKSDGSHQRYGFVAQELYEVAPEAVSKPQDPDEMMAVDYSKLVPMLVKEIQSLRQRVAQLEGI